MHGCKRLGPHPVTRLTADQIEPRTVDVSDEAAGVGRPDHLWRLVCQSAKQRLLAGQRRSAFAHLLLEPAIELINLLQQLRVFYRA